MSVGRPHAITWTETALKLAEAIRSAERQRYLKNAYRVLTRLKS
jgi:hypothetical protein